MILAEHEESTRESGALHAALEVLTERERRVFGARRLTEHPPTFDRPARELSISSERVRQIETRAFAKVKRAARRHLWPDRLALRCQPELNVREGARACSVERRQLGTNIDSRDQRSGSLRERAKICSSAAERQRNPQLYRSTEGSTRTHISSENAQ